MAFKRWSICADNHGDAQDDLAVEAFLAFVNDIWKPEIRIHAGDNWDFRPLRGKATEEEKREGLTADYQAGRQFIQRYRPTHKVKGNHDQRLWDLAKNGKGVASDFAHQLIAEIESEFADMGCQVMPYGKRAGFLQIGQLGVNHGFGGGLVAFREALRSYSSRVRVYIQGHIHRDHHETMSSLDDIEGYVCACLCKVDQEYNRGQIGTLAQRNGWMYGVIHEETGRVHAWQAKGLDGAFLIPSDVVQL
jgi:hypothetical protein